MDVDKPDEKSVITYVSSLYDIFPFTPPSKEDQATENVSLSVIMVYYNITFHPFS